ncbi:MAG TPA: hypothetical protein VIY70_13680 [Acidimicrobiia bacterium]
MELALALGAVLLGFAAAIGGSRVAVRNAASLAAGSRIPPFVIGLTLIAIGTDLPEIANSIASSISGHGDLNVGDSVGSTVTQITLVLGLLPFIVGPFAVSRRSIGGIGIATAVMLGVGTVLVADGFLSRVDASVLMAMWVVASAVLWRILPKTGVPELPLGGRVLRRIAAAIFSLAVVGAGAYLAVQGFVVVAEVVGVPEYVISFFGASIGTSLPELVVDITAIRAGNREMAVGDVMGSSMVDASLSIGAGPMVAPVAVTADLAVRGSLAAMGVVGVVAAVLAIREKHTRLSGAALLMIYLAFYPLMLA